MDKAALIKKLTEQIATDLEAVTQTALAAHGAAIHTESKAEDQYDTRGLEASYLAGAASKRAMELQEILDLYKYVDLKSFTMETPIASTAVIELNGEDKRSHYLLMPKGAGMSVDFDGKHIQVISPQSPLGEALLGRKVGDEVEIHVGRNVRDYEITQVW